MIFKTQPEDNEIALHWEKELRKVLEEKEEIFRETQNQGS